MKPNVLKKSKIFDRINERALLQDFLVNMVDTSILVEGESGSGKSAIIHTVIDYLRSEEEKISFCFADNEEGDNTFTEWLNHTYDKIRLTRKLKLKDFRVNIPFIGTSAGFEWRDEEYTICYFENFIERAISNKISVVYLSNVELCKQSEREHIKCFLKAANQAKFKIIIEQGTLPNGKQWLNQTLAYIDRYLSVETFNKVETEKLFKHIHKSDAPIEIFGQSRGNSLCVKYYGSTTVSEPRLAWAKKLLKKQTVFDRSLLRLLSAIGGPVKLEKLRTFFDDIELLCTAIERLVHNDLLTSSEKGYEFSHPIFASFLSTKYLGEIENEHLSKVLHYFVKNNKQSFSNLCTAYTLSEKMQNTDYKTKLAKSLLPAALSNQNYLLALKLVGTLIEAENNKEQLLLLRIQLLIQIGDAKSANLCFKYLSDLPNCNFKEEAMVLRSFILYGLDRFDESLSNIKKVCIDSKNTRIASIAWGNAASNAIAIGDTIAAKEYFSEAYALARHINDVDLIMDCGRIAARVLPFELARSFIYESIKLNPNASVSKAKLIHTLGTLKLMEFGGNAGVEELKQAQQIFEDQGLVLSSHSYIALGLIEILQENYASARNTLLDGLNVAFESLDRFALLSNVAMAYALDSDPQNALKYAQLGFKQVGGAKSKHQDKLIENAKWYNLAIAYLGVGNIDKAKLATKNLSTECLSRWPEQFFARQERLLSAINNGQQSFSIINGCSFRQDWFVDYYNWVPMLLSFYGFKVDIINNQNLSIYMPS